MAIDRTDATPDLRAEAERLVARAGALSGHCPAALRPALDAALEGLREELEEDEDVPPTADRSVRNLDVVFQEIAGNDGGAGELADVLEALTTLYAFLPEGFTWAWRTQAARPGDEAREATVWDGEAFGFYLPHRFHTGALAVAEIAARPDTETVDTVEDFFPALLWTVSPRNWVLLGRKDTCESFAELADRAERCVEVVPDTGVVLCSLDLNDDDARQSLSEVAFYDGVVALNLESPSDLGTIAGYLRDEARFIAEERDGEPEHIADVVSFAFLMGEGELDPAVAVLVLRVRAVCLPYLGQSDVAGVYGVRLPPVLAG